MINLTNGKVNLRVSKSQYEESKKHYESLGFNIVGGCPTNNKKNVEKNVIKENIKKNLEKPIEEWSKDEIKTYAKEHNIDLTEAKSMEDARQIVAKYLK